MEKNKLVLSALVEEYYLWGKEIQKYDIDDYLKLDLEKYIYAINDIEHEKLHKLVAAFEAVDTVQEIIIDATSYWLEKHHSPYKKRLNSHTMDVQELIREAMEDIIEIDFERIDKDLGLITYEKDIDEEQFSHRRDFFNGNE